MIKQAPRRQKIAQEEADAVPEDVRRCGLAVRRYITSDGHRETAVEVLKRIQGGDYIDVKIGKADFNPECCTCKCRCELFCYEVATSGFTHTLKKQRFSSCTFPVHSSRVPGRLNARANTRRRRGRAA